MIDQLKGLFKVGSGYLKILRRGDGKGFNLVFGMADTSYPPQLTYKTLKGLSELFGTDEIDVNDYSLSGGCDTCDYGADHYHEIQVYNPKKLVDEVNALVAKTGVYEVMK